MVNKYNILKQYNINLRLIENIIGNNATDNITINNLAKYLFNKKFIGVFSSDAKFSLKNGQYCIINNKPKGDKGEHWVAIAKKGNKTYYYDTFNRSLKKLSKEWINKDWINCNSDIDQSENEENCGARSLAWLLSFSIHGEKIKYII